MFRSPISGLATSRLVAAAGLALVGLAPMAGAATPQASVAVRTDGPHSPQGRHPVATSVTSQDGVSVSHYDLGDVEVGSTPGQFRAPVRGSLVLPAHGVKPSKVIIVSHLRSAGCAGGVFAFPCPGADVRLDRGMEYLGKALAKQGYAVLIPDVAPVWMGSTLTEPYDQTQAWLKVVGTARKALIDDDRTGSQHFGLPLTGRINLGPAGLIVHSRSGFIGAPAAQTWASGTLPIRAVLAYGPAYDVPDVHNHVTGPMPAAVPYLGLVGDQDNDVPFNANMWLAANINQPRSAPALVATVPGLGHDYVNQALSSTHTDDRLNCTPATCASATVHERFLEDVSADYFNATLTGAPTRLPLRSSDALPSKIAGLPAQWNAVTNTPKRFLLLNADKKTVPLVSRGSHVSRCRLYDPQDPRQYGDRCPEADSGAVMLVSSVDRVQFAPRGAMSLPLSATGVSAVDLQLTPYGDRADHAAASPLTVAVRTSDGRRVELPIPAEASSVLKNRATADSNGTYVLGTMRVPIPAQLRSATITAVEITAPRGGTFAVRSIDVVAAKAHAGVVPGATHSTAPGASSPGGSAVATAKPSTPATHKPAAPSPATPAVGPVVQTDRAPELADGSGLLAAGGVAGLAIAALLRARIRRAR